MFGKKPSELSVEQLKKLRKFSIGFLIGLCLLWVCFLFYMHTAEKPISVFIAVAIASMVPNFINLINFSNEIKKRENK